MARGLLFIALVMPCLAFSGSRCPWLNAATAEGVLGGSVEMSVASTSCEFARQGVTLRIEVTPANAPPAHCGPGAEVLKAIGNQAVACAYEGQVGWVAEQVVGRVRDQAFVVRISAADRAIAKLLREKAVRIAEQVAGILY